MGRSSGRGFGRVNLIGACLAFGLTNAAVAQTAGNPSTFDVLGIRLGMTADEVAKIAASNIPNTTIAPRQGTLTSGPYTTPTLTFSEEISDGPDQQIGNQPDLEYLKIIFSMKPNNPVIWVDRQTSFSQAKAPSVQGLVTLVEQKYGKPDAISISPGFGDTELVYTYKSTLAPTGIDADVCTNAMSTAVGTASTLLGGDFDQNQEGHGHDAIRNCGIWLDVDIAPDSSNSQLASRLEMELADLPGMADSIDYMLSSLASNAASTAASQAQGAAGNKPQL